MMMKTVLMSDEDENNAAKLSDEQMLTTWQWRRKQCWWAMKTKTMLMSDEDENDADERWWWRDSNALQQQASDHNQYLFARRGRAQYDGDDHDHDDNYVQKAEEQDGFVKTQLNWKKTMMLTMLYIINCDETEPILFFQALPNCLCVTWGVRGAPLVLTGLADIGWIYQADACHLDIPGLILYQAIRNEDTCHFGDGG